MKKITTKHSALLFISSILWLFSTQTFARSSYNLQTQVLHMSTVSIDGVYFEVNLAFDGNQTFTLIDSKPANQTSDQPVIYDSTTRIASIPYAEVPEIGKAYSASLTLVSVDPAVTLKLTSLEEIAVLPPTEATTAPISGKVQDIPSSIPFDQLQISSFYDSKKINVDGSYSVATSKLGNTLVTLETNKTPIMLGLMSPESLTSDNIVNAESTAKALLFITGIFNTTDASDDQKIEDLLNSTVSFIELVDYIRLGVQNQTWRLDETNLELREKVYAVLSEVIATKQKITGKKKNKANQRLKKEKDGGYGDGDIEFPQPSREINSLKIVDPSRTEDDFLFRVQNRGKRWVSAIVKKGHLDAEERFIFKQTGDIHLIPSPPVSLLDYADFIFHGTETPAIVWPLKQGAIKPFKESLQIVSNDVSTTDAIRIVLLGASSEKNAYIEGEKEENALLLSYIFTGIFDILRPGLEMIFGSNKIHPFSKPKLMLPKEATSPFLKEVIKRFYKKQLLSERNWLLQLQQGETSAVMSDITDSISKTFADEPGLAVSFLLPYLPDNVLLNATKFSALLKKFNIFLKLLDIGGSGYNLLHTAIDTNTLNVRTEFRYKKMPVEPIEPDITTGRCSDQISFCDPYIYNKAACEIYRSVLIGRPCNSDFKITKLEYKKSYTLSLNSDLLDVGGKLYVHWEAPLVFWTTTYNQRVHFYLFNASWDGPEGDEGGTSTLFPWLRRGGAFYNINKSLSPAPSYFKNDAIYSSMTTAYHPVYAGILGCHSGLGLPYTKLGTSTLKGELVAVDTDFRILDRKEISFTCHLTN